VIKEKKEIGGDFAIEGEVQIPPRALAEAIWIAQVKNVSRMVNMFTPITVEGIRIKARMIPRRQLVSIWKMLTIKPFPRVKGFRVEDGDFDHVIKISKSRDDERREREEWGRVLSPEGTDAFVVNMNESTDVDYLILVRRNPYHNLEDVLQHEMSHIAKGDL
jgi:hypothetical protein